MGYDTERMFEREKKGIKTVMAKKETYDAGSISVLEGLEAVRKRPGMYIGSVSRKGLNHLIYEIVDNAVDEHLAGYCTNIHVVLEKDGSCTVADNGRGIPVDMHEKGVSAERLVFTTLHAGGKFDNSAYKTSGGLHGVGSSVVNALSTYLDIKISRDGYVHHDRYERGIPAIELEDGLLPKLGRTRETGTCVNFLPDPEIFEKTRFSATEVKSRLHETAYLNPELTILFEDRRGDETEAEEYHEPEGIVGYLRDLNHKSEVLHEPVLLKGEADGIQVEAAFQYTNEFRENVLGFCNNIYNAEGGTHLTGFKTTFTTVMNTYAREIGVLKDKDANFTGADIRNGMTAVVSIKHPAPRFEGQTKTKLDNQDAAKATGKVLGEQLVLFFDRNLETLKAVLSCAEKAAKIRKTEERAKTNLLTKQYHEPEGIVGYLRDLNHKSEVLHEPVLLKGEADGIQVEAAFQYTNEFRENVLGFCNNIYNAEGGTHLTGFKTTFTTVMNTYAREIGVLKDKDANFTGADIRNGMTAVVSIKHPAPRFEGQTKTKLDNQDAAKATGKVLGEQLVLFFDRNLETLKAVLSCAEKAAKIRKTEERAKTNLLTKQKYSFDSNGKLANCEKKDPSQCEIFIVEGDSAGGSAKTARNRNYQAILPIRGKILNVEKATIDKVLANAEIKTMINAFGCGFSEGYGNDFDISKLRYDKIVIMADADVDGAHISTLLLTLFYRFMPELIYEGHVYIAMPPLYKAMPKKGPEEYLYDDKALEKYRKTHKPGSFTLQRYKGLGEMDADQLWETTLNPETRRMKRVEIEDARLASSITEILMGSDVPPRKAFIYEHAADAELDV